MNKFAKAVDLDLRLPPEYLAVLIATHGLALVALMVVGGIVTPLGLLLLAISALVHWRHWYGWPWCRLIWKPGGTLLAIDNVGDQYPAQWLPACFVSRCLILPVFSARDAEWRPMLVRRNQQQACRRLAVRFRCQAASGADGRVG